VHVAAITIPARATWGYFGQQAVIARISATNKCYPTTSSASTLVSQDCAQVRTNI
jgi:hypothetical protein